MNGYLVIKPEHSNPESHWKTDFNGATYFTNFKDAKAYSDKTGGGVVEVQGILTNGVGIFYPLPENSHECVKHFHDRKMKEA